jgi:hypothetical protein
MSRRRITTGILAAGLIVSSFSFVPSKAHAAANELTIFLENQKLSADVQPVIIKDRTFIPLYSLADLVGAQLDYDATTHTVTCSKEDLTFTLDFRQGIVKKNGMILTMDPAPLILNGRTMVPLRSFAEAFGYQVEYSDDTKTVHVTPSPELVKKRQWIKDLIQKSDEATNAKKSYRMNIGLRASLPNGILKADITGNMQFDYNKSPFVLHGKGSIDLPLQTQAQHFDVEMYMKDGIIYYQNPEMKRWEKVTIMSAAEWNQLMELSTSTNLTNQQEKDLNLLLPFATYSDQGNTYEIRFSLNPSGIKTLLKNSPSPVTNGNLDPQQMDEELRVLKTLQVTQTIDKSTWLQQGFSVNLDLALPNATSKITINGTISDFDQVPVIDIPQEILQNAVDVTAH